MCRISTGRFFNAMLIEGGNLVLLKHAVLSDSPVLAFRWLKSPGEIYGRSPVMKALPDIKTANKVVELILKNASIAVTGIWQADDDGVLNIANIELKPGSIIPKAVGSQGLKPLEMPGRFDISQLVLGDLRTRINHALLADKLAPIASARMTATEVLERSAEMALLLGATYGRFADGIDDAAHSTRLCDFAPSRGSAGCEYRWSPGDAGLPFALSAVAGAEECAEYIVLAAGRCRRWGRKHCPPSTCRRRRVCLGMRSACPVILF